MKRLTWKNVQTGLTCGGAVVLLWTGGCAIEVSPDHEQVVGQALTEVVIPGVWSEAAVKGTVPDGWLKEFKDPQLEALVGEALQNNLDLRAAQGVLDEAAASAAAAGASLKPTVDAAGSAAGTQAGGADNNVTQRGVGLTATWELDLWGRVRSQVAAATEQYEGASLDLEFARQSIAAAAAKAYFLTVETTQQVSLAEEDVAASAETLRVVALRRDAGKATEQDVRLSSAQVTASQERLSSATNARDQAVRALEVILGRYPGNDLRVGDALPTMPDAVPAGVPSEVLARRPDVAAAERRVAAAFQNVQTSELAKLPSFALTAGVGVSNELTGMTNRGSGFFGVGANFFAPILDGGALDSQVEIANAQQEQALAAYGQTALQAFIDVENALGGEQTLEEREGLLASSVSDSDEALRLRRLEADAGKADTLTVLQLQRDVYTAKAGLISLRTARLSQRVDLYMSLGGDATTVADSVSVE